MSYTLHAPNSNHYPSKCRYFSLSNDNLVQTSHSRHENLNGLKETQSMIAPTRRQRVIAKRRKGFHLKKKTELCKHYVIGEPCAKGDDCAFAHGIEELRNRPIANYRTVKCRHFQEKGWCQYGPRCQFKHNEKVSEIREVKITYDQLMRTMEESFTLKGWEERSEDMEHFLEKQSSVEAHALPKLSVFMRFRQ